MTKSRSFIRAHLMPYLTGIGLTLVLPHVQAQSELDTTYTPSASWQHEAVAVQADGKVITGEGYRRFSSGTRLVRFNVNGTTDSTFSHAGDTISTANNGFISEVKSVSAFLDGSACFSGYFYVVSNTSAIKVVRINEAGAIVPYRMREAVNTGGPSTPLGWVVAPYIVSLPDNRAYLFGDFTSIGGRGTRNGIARLTTVPDVDATLVASAETSATGQAADYGHQVLCVAPQPDGKILVAGEFDRFNGQSTGHLVRLTSTGALDTAFVANATANGNCRSIALLPDGKMLVAGSFNSIGGGSRSLLAKLNADGTLDTTFNCVLNGSVWSMVPRVDGRIVIGGSFTSVNGSFRGRVALIEADGSLAPAYAFADTDSSVYGIAPQADGKVVMVGVFSSVGGVSRPYIARLNADSPATQSLTIDAEGTSVEWTRGGSAPEVENAEFRLSLTTDTAAAYTTLLGSGTRTATGWKLQGLKLPGNKNIFIQAKGLSRGGFYNASTSVMRGSQSFFRPLPSITTPPASQTVVVGDTGVQFSVVATSAAEMTYQWKKNNVAILSATQPTYVLPGAIAVTSAGSYTCTITSSAGVVTSTAGVLTVITPITITKQPVMQAVLPGKPASFTVTVTGTAPEYKWYQGTTEIPGAIAATYKILAVNGTQHEGNYSVSIKNFAGTVTSIPVPLYEITTKPTIPVPPASAIVPLGHSSHMFSATILSESPPALQWLKNAAPIALATTSSYTLSNLKLTDAGKFTVRATNPFGFFVSDPIAELAVVDRISTKHFVIAQGGTATLTAIAAGNGLTYKWKKAGAYIDDTALGVLPGIAGSKTKTLTLKGLTTAQTAAYTCEVINGAGSLDSASQQVTVTTGPPVIDTALDFPPAMVGASYDYTVSVDGTVELTPNKFEQVGLPAGLVIDPFSGRITGRPTLALTTIKSYDVTIKVSNGSGKALLSRTDQLVVYPVTAGLVGTFIAVMPPVTTVPSFRNGARLDLTATTAGTYSGSVTLGTLRYPIISTRLNYGLVAGVPFNNPNTITVSRGTILPPLTLQFTVDDVSQLLTGSLTEGPNTAPLEGWKNVWTTVKAPTYKGYYTMAITAPTPAVGDLSYPLGDGYATFTVADTGAYTATVRLADGTVAITMSGLFVGPTGQLAFYGAPYLTTGGAVWGTSPVITPGGLAPDYKESTIAGDLGWVKYPQTTGYIYKDGFGPLTLGTIGAKYAHSTVTLPASNVLGADTLTNDVQLSYTGARVELGPENPTLLVRLTDKNVFIAPTLLSGSNPANSYIGPISTLGVVAATSFTLNEDTDPGPAVKIVKRTATNGAAIVVRNSVTGVGNLYGHFLLRQSPGSVTAPILSGRVRASAVP